MKKIFYITPLLLLAACGPKPQGDKATAKAELEKLKKQQSELNDKIAKLEAQVGTNDSARVTDVGVLEIQPSKFTNYIELQGKIDAQDNVTAYPQVQGTITNIYVKAGQHVGKGQLLVQLDNSVLKQQIAQSEAQLSLSSTVYQRQKALWDQKIGTEVQYLQAKTNYDAGVKQLAAVKEQAAMYTIKSPINGSIDQMNLKLGQAVQPGQNESGIRIVNAENLKVKADVPESYGAKVSTGDMVRIVLPDIQDSIQAKVTFAAKVIDPTSRSFGVEVNLPSGRGLRPNMTSLLKIVDYQKNDALVVPVNAIQKSEAGDYVFVVNNGAAKKVNIKAGATYAGKTEVRDGLKVGDKVITAGGADLEDGDKVKVGQ